MSQIQSSGVWSAIPATWKFLAAQVHPVAHVQDERADESLLDHCPTWPDPASRGYQRLVDGGRGGCAALGVHGNVDPGIGQSDEGKRERPRPRRDAGRPE